MATMTSLTLVVLLTGPTQHSNSPSVSISIFYRRDLMITINQARKLKEVFDKLKKDIMSNNVTFNDIAVMAEISDRMKADVIDIKDIVNGIDIPYEVVEDEDVEETEEPTTPTPTTESFSVPEPKGFWTEMDADAEWRLVSDGNYMVSDKGMIVSLDQERVMRPMFIDGELIAIK